MTDRACYFCLMLYQNPESYFQMVIVLLESDDKPDPQPVGAKESMPEGPEVKTVARTLTEQMAGQTLGHFWHSHHKLRKAVNYTAFKRLENQRIDEICCYGKILFFSCQKKPVFMAQLGMTGQLTVNNIDDPLKDHTHIRWQILGQRKEMRYVDPRRFGLVDICDDESKKSILRRLGPDPFSMTDEDRPGLILAMKKSLRPIKEILLDQSVIVGVGNIYASEALFVASIDPKKRGCEISEPQYQKLITAVTDILSLAYQNCGTTFSNYVDGSGKKGDNLQFLKVFQKEGEPCPQCNRAILRIKQGGRSTFFCQNCQV